MRDAIELGRDVCRLAGAFSLSVDIEREMLSSGVVAGVRHHETSAIFSYFMSCFSLQGISDRVALAYQDAREKLAMDSVAPIWRRIAVARSWQAFGILTIADTKSPHSRERMIRSSITAWFQLTI